VGLETANLPPRLAAQMGWDRTYGALVTDVEPGSPAEQAGIRRGDVVAEMGGSRINDAEDFETRARGYPAKASFPLVVFREGELRNLHVTPVEFPIRLVEALTWDKLGLRVKEGRGVMAIAAVRPGTVASEIGLEPGDVIVRVNNQPVDTTDAFREALVGARRDRGVLLLVRRGRNGYHVTLPFQQGQRL
jgi:S1-C subfamily serine protease